jgi:uncharacterized protein
MTAASEVKLKTAATKPRSAGSPTVTMNAIRRVVDQIVARFSPRQVILFGSRAQGRARPDSDVDLLVITDRPAGPDASLRIRRRIEYAFPLDLIVCDTKRLHDRVAAGDFLLGDAVRRGRVLYENPDR